MAQVRAPVFIVGAPRSGTTLLRVILNRHPQLSVCGETEYFSRVYVRRRTFGDPGDLRNRARVIAAYLAVDRLVSRLGMDTEVLRERLMSEGADWRELFATLLKTYADSTGKQYTGEKTPAHALHVQTLCEWFPDCGIIHLVRDPRAAVHSLTKVRWASRSVLQGVRTWRQFDEAARRVSTRQNYLRVKYEGLVARPEEQLMRICDHIGLPYQAAMLQPDQAEFDTPLPVQKEHGAITATRVALWRDELRPWQVAAIEARAARSMERYGYERCTQGAATGAMLRALMEAFAELTLQKLLRAPSAYYHFFHPSNLASEEKWKLRAWALYSRLRLNGSARLHKKPGVPERP